MAEKSAEKAPKVAKAKNKTATTMVGTEPGDSIKIVTTFEPITTFVVRVTKVADGKKERVRGATEKHANRGEAELRVAKLVDALTKLGWKARSRTRMAKADAFDAGHLPTPKSVANIKK